ncbi:MAG: translation initiation factor IF-2, partial [Vicinamibacteria bacterium]|nr:translation initiation factor IF-2 [Vicinamibacteria bacterium]
EDETEAEAIESVVEPEVEPVVEPDQAAQPGNTAAPAAAPEGYIPPAPKLSPPRVIGPVRPIAPPAPVAPPPAPASVAPAPVTPKIAPRAVRPIAPLRPAIAARAPGHGQHATAVTPHAQHPVAQLPRSPHAVGGVAARPVTPIPGRTGAYPGAPAARPIASRKTDRHARAAAPAPREEKPVYTGPPRKIVLTEGVTVKELGEKMIDVKSRDIIKSLLTRGVMATINQSIGHTLAVEICKEFNYEAVIQSFEDVVVQEQELQSRPEDLAPRAPVVTVMGHVDHGKTSLLDAIRETSVATREAGGITQHIGAYQVEVQSRKVDFLDTPGHEAFTLMRARGAKVTDIVVLVVAADDGVMPQTLEAIDHSKAANVPIIVAVNKIDKPEAQPDRVRKQLADRGLMPEEWGGSTVFVNVSAKKKENLDQLLEMILLVADMQELKANAKRPAMGTVLEARLDKGRGPVATILIQDGTLEVGATVVAGAVSGKIRALVDDQGRRIRTAGPATPVEVLGLSSLPGPGDQLFAVTDTVKAQSIVNFRQQKLREKAMAASSKIKLEDLGRAVAEGQIKELPLVIKADVTGSVEAIVDQLAKIPQEKIKLKIIRSGTGAITEGDVLLAVASDAVVIGFNVRPERKAADAAERDRVDVRLYTVIYDLVEEMRKALEGLLEPSIREVRLGSAEVRDTFKISKIGTVAGCLVADGRVLRSAQVRLLRDNVVIHTGKVLSLKRFKDDASEVKAGQECGIAIANYNDVKPADVIEFFTTERVKETLE